MSAFPNVTRHERETVMKKQSDRKLSLNRETLAPLTPDALDAIHGGAASLTLTPMTSQLTPPLTTLVSRLTNCTTGPLAK